ncbi:hypothetical protein CR513_43899, partial [Mucuna pruriens]
EHYISTIRVAQRKRGGPITHRSLDRNQALIKRVASANFTSVIKVAQRKRGGPITHRSLDRNQALIKNSVNIKYHNQSGAAEAWWAHNPQVPGSKPGSDKKVASANFFLPICFLFFY